MFKLYGGFCLSTVGLELSGQDSTAGVAQKCVLKFVEFLTKCMSSPRGLETICTAAEKNASSCTCTCLR